MVQAPTPLFLLLKSLFIHEKEKKKRKNPLFLLLHFSFFFIFRNSFPLVEDEKKYKATFYN